MKKIIISMSFLIFIFLISCAGLGDFHIDLSDGYTVIRTSGHNVKIVTRISEYIFSDNIVPPKVVEVVWNDDYILAKQLELVIDPNSHNKYLIPDNKKDFYWIIVTESDEVFGPLTFEQFNTMKEELGIPNDLILKDVEDFRSLNE